MPFVPNAAERRRREQFVRAGAGFVRPENTIETPGIGIDAPVTSAQLNEPVLIYLAAEMRGSGIVYPDFFWLETGKVNGSVIGVDSSGSLFVDFPTFSFTAYDLSANGIGPDSILRLATYYDPAGSASLFLNGDLVEQVTGAPSQWGDLVDWAFLDLAPDDVGAFGPVEIFPGFKPAIV